MDVAPQSIGPNGNHLVLYLLIGIAFHVAALGRLAGSAQSLGVVEGVVEGLHSHHMFLLEDGVEGVSDVVEDHFSSVGMEHGECEGAVALEFEGAY